ncbi:10755_t:CDS:2 [Ambispora gerdemannii]|uniref:10755_t:CDS:1 n=1 Tax=Ambispora gerdemannii TaxID=144530 RepID=A0A9N9BBJ7_9GLOM|nr:10755_t:CDS:2 [Ambispora gerdemannii]
MPNFVVELTKPARKRGNSAKPPRPQNSWIIFRYKPKNTKDSSAKKWVFRELKRYALTSSHNPSSTSNNSPPQEAAQIVMSSSLNINVNNNNDSLRSSQIRYDSFLH